MKCPDVIAIGPCHLFQMIAECTPGFFEVSPAALWLLVSEFAASRAASSA
jgi:hypothetical protein